MNVKDVQQNPAKAQVVRSRALEAKEPCLLEPEMTLEREPRELLRDRLRSLMDDGQYETYINEVSELAEHQGMTDEFVYDTAYAYFMLGDYERAAAWINSTLTLAPGHLEARILLARLCLMEDRIDDGLAVFDFVLDKGQDALDGDKREELDDILSFYGRNEGEMIRQKYPHIAAFLHLIEVPEAVEPSAPEAVPAKPSGVFDVVFGREQAEKPALASTVAEKASSVLNALKRKIAAATTEVTPEPEPIAPPVPTPAVNEPTTAQTIDDVMSRPIGLRQKVNALNKFAAAEYLAQNLDAARQLLKAALSLDEDDQKALRNLAVLELEAGNRDLALQLVANMRRTDFALLRLFKAQ